MACDPLIALPQEVVLFWVFPCLDFIDICLLREVSTHWKHLAEVYFGQLKVMDVTPFQDMLTSDGFSYIILYLKHLTEVNLNSCWISATLSNLLLIGNRCSKLQIFSAEHCKEVTDDVLANFGKRCKHLQVVSISFCFSISDKGVTDLVRGCTSLKVLRVGNNFGVSDASVKEVAKHCQQLEELDISRCFLVSDTGFSSFLDKGKENLTLSYVRVTGCNRLSQELMYKFASRGIVVNNCF